MFELKPEDFGEKPAGQGGAETATRECPHCSKTIDAAAAVCPHCNLPTDELIQVDLFPKSPYRTMRRLLDPRTIILAFVTVGLAFGLYGFVAMQQILGDTYAAAGDHLIAEGNYAAAVEFYRRALHYIPRDPAAHEQLGWAEYQLSLDADALQHFERALALDPDRSMSLYGAGLSAYQLRDYNRAISYLERFIEGAPEHAGAYEYLGLAEYRLGRRELAFGYLNEALVYNPQNATALYYVGRILAQRGDAEAAIDSFDRAGELGFDPGAIANARGLAWMQAGNYVSARDDFQEVLLAYPMRMDVVLSLAKSLYLLEDYPEARARLAVIQTEVPPDLQPDYLALWGWISLRLGNNEAARAAFNSWVNLQPDQARALNALGWATHYSGDCGTADVYFQDAIQSLDGEAMRFDDPLAAQDETPQAGLELQCP